MSYYAVDFDWNDELENNYSNWANLGKVELEKSCNCKNKETGDLTQVEYSGYCSECQISEGDCQPMMNYGYKLYCEPSEEKILKVVKNTCLTIMYKVDTGEYFLVLCGGGMDLSQQIGLAYLYTDERIPETLINEISKQKGLAVGGEEWKFLRNSIIEELKQNVENSKRKLSQKRFSI